MLHPGAHLPAPLGVHGVDAAGGGEQVHHLVFGVAVAALGADVLVRWPPGAVFELADLVKCQPARLASARAVSPASSRISRSRAPRASRACWGRAGMHLALAAREINTASSNPAGRHGIRTMIGFWLRACFSRYPSIAGRLIRGLTGVRQLSQ